MRARCGVCVAADKVMLQDDTGGAAGNDTGMGASSNTRPA